MSSRAEYMREWAKKNPEKKKLNDQHSYQKHRQERILTVKLWAERNIEKTIQYKRKWEQNNLDHSHSKIRFKDKRIQLDHVPRIGICSHCYRTIESGEIKVTNLHHIKYDEVNPLNHTVELCVSCHRKIHANLVTL